MEAMWALKRRLSDVVYRTMLDDAIGYSPSRQRRARDGNRERTLRIF